MLFPGVKSGFIRNFSTLFTGTAIAQAIPVLLQPLLRRLFEPEVFAIFAVYNSVTSILIVLTTLRYEMAIMLPEKDREASALVMLSLGINLFFSFLFLLFIAIFPSLTARWISWPEGMNLWLWMIPPAVLLFSANQTLNYWLIRRKAFRASAVNRISRRISEGVVQSAGGGLSWQGALLWGDLFGRLVNLGFAWKQSVNHQLSFTREDLPLIRKMAVRYKDFPLYQAIPALLNTASLMLPVLLVNRFYTPDTTAQFDLCRQVLLLPLALITTAMSQVLLQKFTEQRNLKQRILPGFFRISAFTAAGALLVVLFFLFTGKPLFSFLFGKPWGIAGSYATILAPAFMIQFVVSPVSTLIIALEKIRIGALWQVLYFGAILSLFLFRHLPPERFFVVFSLLNLAFYVMYWLVILMITLRYEDQRMRHLKKS